MTRSSVALAVAIVLVLLTGACAHKSRVSSQKTSEAQAAAPKGNVVCFNESPTGSHLLQRVCYAREDLDDTAMATQDAFRRALQMGSQIRSQRGARTGK